LSAIASGLMSHTQGAAKIFDAGGVSQTVVEMERGLLFVMRIANGSVFAVLAASDCDLGLVAYEMTLVTDALMDSDGGRRDGSRQSLGIRSGRPAALVG
jgi:uncharacterized protein